MNLRYLFHPHLLFLWMGCLFVTGCMVGPNYRTPISAIPDAWKENLSEESTFSTTTPTTEWWKLLEDALLTKYIEMGMRNNNDILKAEANILQAKALRQIAASKLFPQIDFDTNASKTFFSKNGPIITGESITGGAPTVAAFQIQNIFNAFFDASWEIDLFGKNRRAVEAAKAEVESSIEAKNGTLITVMAEIARNYLELRAYQKRKALIEDQIDNFQQEINITQANYSAGYQNLLNLDSIEAEMKTVSAELPDTIAQIYRNIYILSILTGQLPEALEEELLVVRPLPLPPTNIAVGLRSDLLKRRPDIRQAERALAAATANIGVAVANFYPTFILGANIGLQSLQLKKLFQLPSRSWMYGGDIRLPIFKGGRLIGNLRAARAETAAAAYTYQQTILNALQETQNALISFNEDLQITSELNKSVEKNQNLVFLKKERLSKGLVDKMEWLDSNIRLIVAEKLLLDSKLKSLTDLIILYKALGGGWQTVEERKESVLQVLDSCCSEKSVKKPAAPPGK